MSLIVWGKASNKRLELETPTARIHENLLSFLHSNGIMVASSCNGVGVCQKCKMQEELLICEFSVEEYLKKHPRKPIEIDYL